MQESYKEKKKRKKEDSQSGSFLIDDSLPPLTQQKYPITKCLDDQVSPESQPPTLSPKNVDFRHFWNSFNIRFELI